MRRSLIRSTLAAGVLGLVLSAGAALVPPVAAPVSPLFAAMDAPVARAAEDELGIVTATRYVVVPEQGVIRVTVDITATNEKPDSVSGGVVTRFFYDGVNIGVQPEATRFRAVEGDAPLRVSADRRDGYRLVAITFRSELFYQEQVEIRLTYDLPAGEPRSASDVRVGPAFASFLAWAFGDRGSVRVDVPPAFVVDVAGADMERETVAGGVQRFRATTADPAEWFAWINARNDEGLTRQRVVLEGGDEIIVRAWPEDTRWRGRVAAVLGDGVPELVRRIGLPWPVDGRLNVLEVHTPLLEGYAGFYDPQADEITISEDLDDVTIVHEASHAWFNDWLFTERWITEGLAETYAAEVVNAIGGDAPGPRAVKRTQPEAFPLQRWPPPSPIESDEADAREEYGYAASFRVISEIVDEVGEEAMRAVFAAADARLTAYRGEVRPERTALANDWRRFLDLTEELGGATGVADLLAEWALDEGAAQDLRARAAARAAYRELIADGGTWAAPVVVRLALDGWRFDEAQASIRTAVDVIGLRDGIEALAAEEGLAAPGELERRYEAADREAELVAVRTDAVETRSSLVAVAAAGDAAAVPRDWLVNLGLVGKAPDVDLAAARAAWEAGDPETALATAQMVVGTLAVAGDAGTARALAVAAIVILVVALLVAVVLLLRRSRHRASAGGERAQVATGGDAGVVRGPLED